jgi:hypothetical protein
MEEFFGRSDLPGALLKKWPRDARGEPVPPKFLAFRPSTDLADVLLVNLLDAYGIPALLLHPGDGDFGKVILGISGTGSRIFVPETLYEDALDLMEAQQQDDGLPDGI